MTVSRVRFGSAVSSPASAPALVRASILALALVSSGGVTAAPAAFESGVRDFVASQASELGYSRDELATLMADARYQQDIIDAMNRPYEAKPWREYRPLFLTEERINGGAAFLRHNAAVLKRA
jgi:membrane-bound lytic murein transglycosylase B